MWFSFRQILIHDRGLRSIGLFLFDILSDVRQAVQYPAEGHTEWFAWTLSFVVVANLITTLMGVAYWSEEDYECKLYGSSVYIRRCVRSLFAILNITPVL